MTILVGQRVTWLHTSRRGGVVTMTTREGIVERIEGATAYVRRGRRIESVDRNALRWAAHYPGGPQRQGTVTHHKERDG